MDALILAGGRGKRMLHLTEDKPKALIEIKGKTLLEYTLNNLLAANIEKTTIVIGYKGEKIREEIGEDYKGMKIEYAYQPEPLGSGHAMMMAKNHIKTNSFILGACDIIFNTEIYKKLGEMEEAMVVREIYGDPSRFGIVIEENGYLKEIKEKPKNLPIGKYKINAFLHVCKKDIFEYLDKCKKAANGEIHYVDAVMMSNQKRPVKIIEYKGKIIDVSNPEEVKEANNLSQEEFPKVIEI